MTSSAGRRGASARISAAVLERDVLTGVSMAFVGGFVDAAGFIALAGLFTSHVTGNFVLIGDHLATGVGGVVAKLLALPVFVLAVGGARLVALATERRGVAPMRPLLLLEALLLLAFLLSGMVLSPLRLPDSIAAISVGMFAVAAMGVQNAIGRLAIAHLAATTVMTVNVAQATIDALDIWLGTAPDHGRPSKARLWRMAPAIGSFALGALTGAFGFAIYAFACVAVPILVLLVLFAMLGVRPEGKTRAEKMHSGEPPKSRPVQRPQRVSSGPRLTAAWRQKRKSVRSRKADLSAHRSMFKELPFDAVRAGSSEPPSLSDNHPRSRRPKI